MRVLKILAVILAVASAPWAGAVAETLRLKPSAMVEADMVAVGDLFHDAGSAAATPLFASPEPGQSIVYALADIRRATDSLGLAWHAPSGLEGVAVERLSQRVTQDDIEAFLLRALRAEAGSDRLDLHLQQRDIEIDVATGAPAEIMLRNLRFDPRNARFDAVLEVGAGGGPRQALRLSGRAYALIDMPVPVRLIRAGEVVSAADIETVEMRLSDVDAQAALNAETIVGYAARRALRAGMPVRLADLAPPLLVTKGNVVTMIYETASLRLSTLGRALENGAEGAFVRVLNPQSNVVVQGIVSAENTVVLSASTLTLPN